ncbi:MAG: M64 family metallopeptidase [Fibrobacterota bacterium]
MQKITVSSLLLLVGLAWTTSLSPLQITGPDSNRIRLIIVGDGFTMNHQEAYERWTDTLINAIFSSQPFKTYKNLFNIYRLNTISPDSGISDDFEQYYVENTFNTTSTAIGTLATDTGILGDSLRMFFPNWNFQLKKSFVVLIANSSAPMVDGYKLADNATAICFRSSLQKTGPHKFGQLFGNLDELCTGFSALDFEILVSRYHQKSKMYDAIYPVRQSVALGAHSNTFSVKMADTLNIKYNVKWYVDGREIAGASGFSYQLKPEAKHAQTPRQIKCRFRDVSNFKYPVSLIDSAVFNALALPDSIMTDSIVWTLQTTTGTENSEKAQAITQPFLGLQRSANGFDMTVTSAAPFQLAVYDVRGRLIRVLGQGNLGFAEKYSFQPQSAGIYIARLYTNGQYLSKKAVMAD